jgi:hypothetical protein
MDTRPMAMSNFYVMSSRNPRMVWIYLMKID